MVRTLSLNGPWLIRADPGNVGLAEQWFHTPDEFLNPTLCKAIDVPRAWQHVLGEEYHYLAWYRRRIEIPGDWSPARARLRFEAVATEIDVWINGIHAGHHLGDSIPCEFDISQQARPGATLDIVLRVDEVLGHITKGFHDMLSIHHGGIWDDVSLVGSGAVFARPNGVAVRADARTGGVEVIAELAEASAHTGTLRLEVADASGAVVATHEARFEQRDTVAATVAVSDPEFWRPDAPHLYTARIDLLEESGEADHHEIRFGFRTLEIRGAQVFLNDSPIHVRGILHWGHEPRHLAPAPPPDQVRQEFARLHELGFNCVCLCMWYPPRHYFDIADETGMLIWQEHPVWHSPMSPALLPEYRRLYTEFLRRDRNHPSVIIVSATCEHPCFDKELAAWWWKTARDMLPGKLLQVQTASFAWSDPAQTDLYDEHTYDNNNRWITYLDDLQVKLRELPPKPFIMGESVLFTSWPPYAAIARARDSQSFRWSRPNYHEAGKAFERDVVARYGSDVLARFGRQADRHHLLGRKFQIEMFRRYRNHAGLVTNHLRDVPGCTCGFMDALGLWRFTPEQTRGWMCDAPLLLKTPDERRSFASGETVDASILLANFSPGRLRGGVTVTAGLTPDRSHDGSRQVQVDIAAQPGEVASRMFRLPLPDVDSPARLTLTASHAGTQPNSWDLWVFPSAPSLPSGVYRMDGLPFEAADAEPDPLERGYSRGFGLPVRTWVNQLPDPARLVPDAASTSFDAPIPEDARVILTHRLTNPIIDFLTRGGRVILFASKAPGGLGTRYEWLFGQCPLIIEEGPLNSLPLAEGEGQGGGVGAEKSIRGDPPPDPLPGREGDCTSSDWIVDLLSFDLTRTYARVIPIDELGWRDRVQPLVRLVYTHDVSDRLRMLDMLFMTRILPSPTGRGAGGEGEWLSTPGLLMVSSFDHSYPAGQYLLHRMIDFMTHGDASSSPCMGVDELRQHVIDR